MLQQLLRFFFVFLVVVEPISLIPLFVGMTEGVAEPERRQMARRAIVLSGIILTVFALGGGPFLRLMSISVDSFRIFGGLLLFLIALEMVFARPPGTRTSTPEEVESQHKRDISVFPLAFPFIAGPGALATMLLAFGPTAGNPLLFAGRVRGARGHARRSISGQPGDEATRRDRHECDQSALRRLTRRTRGAVRDRRAARQLRLEASKQ